ncbi:MAG TPA: DEAD/DEAH box helicase [Opitutaceae bacterium]|nr:DEAD/DEAH box helicase [Opitutaceae bacterium]
MPFSRFGLFSSILRAVQAKGYAEPTPVQVETIPAVLSGRDVIASAQTGTGKTAAFALPIINRLGPHRAGGARVLVLEPTRELAAQVADAFREFAQFTDLHVDLIQGGVGYGKQRAALVDGADIVVATVGRLLELIDERAVKLDALQVLVLDEVDRMLDMGFIDDVKAIVGRCPPRRQTLFFSATVPGTIEEVARFALREPVRISIGRVRTVPASVNHALYPVPGPLKFRLLLALLEKTEFRSVIVFTRTKEGADGIVARLKQSGHSAAVLHGDRSHGQRKAALAGFKDGYYEILVATDIAARGLDLSDVTHVINYDIPLTPDDYVHRVGRTGRSSATGDAFTLFTPRESGAVQAIEKFIRAEIPRRQLEGFDYHALPTAAEFGAENRGTRSPKPKDDGWAEMIIGAKKRLPVATGGAKPVPPRQPKPQPKPTAKAEAKHAAPAKTDPRTAHSKPFGKNRFGGHKRR